MPRFTNLRIWHAARDVVRDVAATCGSMRSEGDLKSQLRRAAISIVSNIAEGSERGSDREFAHFLKIARGSCAEAHAQISIAADIGIVATTRAEAIVTQLDSLGRMLTRFIDRLDAGP